MSDLIGRTLGHYRIVEKIGEGGMGVVFLAEDTNLDRKVALKFLPKDALQNPVAHGRFLREAKSAAALDDPFICKVYETGEVDGEPYIAMEYIEGESLRARLSRGPLSLEETFKTASEVAEALGVAHEHGIIHRDLKPSNIMLTRQRHAKVLDFGLAKQVCFPGEQDTEAETATSDDLTGFGTTMGTLAYMSPEQLRAEPLNPTSDVFSFGVILYEMLSGEHPFNRPSSAETINAILADSTPALEIEEGKVPDELAHILDRALDKNPEKRYGSAAEIAEEMRAAERAVFQPGKGRLPLVAAVAAVAVTIVVMAGLWLISKDKAPVPPAATEPISVLIADFKNQTGDDVFIGVLEQATAIGLEGASFISAYKRGDARKVAEVIQPGDAALDEEMARLVAQREGINVVVAGSISEEDGIYSVSVRAINGATGESIALHRIESDDREGVLAAVGTLAGRTRESLGDTTPESVRMAAKETFTTASIEAARAYAQAQDLMAVGKWQEAAPVYRHAIQLDSNFGRAYAGLAVCYLNLNQLEDSKKYYEEAFARIDRMTDREKYRTRGGYYLLTRNYEKAAEEYEALVREFPSDPAGPSNLAFAFFYARDMPKALEIGREAAEAHPENILTRANLALYAMYASDFETAAKEAEVVHESNPSYETAYVPEAMALIDQGDFAGAARVYDRLKQISPYGASLAATGAADLALFQGKLTEAAGLLEKGIAGDKANEFDSEAARKLMMLARARFTLGDEPGAIAATNEALTLSRRRNIIFAAAVVLVDARRAERALELSQKLSLQIEPEPQVFAKLIEGKVALENGEPQWAMSLFTEAQGLIDCWIGRYLLGRAYLAAEAYTEAYTDFETCLKRRGEAASLQLDDVPSYHYFPEVYYYLGRAQEGLGSPAAADSYRTFLKIKENGDGDPLVEDAQKRARYGD